MGIGDKLKKIVNPHQNVEDHGWKGAVSPVYSARDHDLFGHHEELLGSKWADPLYNSDGTNPDGTSKGDSQSTQGSASAISGGADGVNSSSTFYQSSNNVGTTSRSRDNFNEMSLEEKLAYYENRITQLESTVAEQTNRVRLPYGWAIKDESGNYVLESTDRYNQWGGEDEHDFEDTKWRANISAVNQLNRPQTDTSTFPSNNSIQPSTTASAMSGRVGRMNSATTFYPSSNKVGDTSWPTY
jgi:hypothetical protein